MFQMMGVFAEFERAIIRERVMAGLARAREEGTKLGRRPIEVADAKKASAIRVWGGWVNDLKPPFLKGRSVRGFRNTGNRRG